MKGHDAFRARSDGTRAGWQPGRIKDMVGDRAGKKKSGRIVKEGMARVKVHSSPSVVSCSGRRTGQGSWGLRVLIFSLGCRTVSSDV